MSEGSAKEEGHALACRSDAPCVIVMELEHKGHELFDFSVLAWVSDRFSGFLPPPRNIRVATQLVLLNSPPNVGSSICELIQDGRLFFFSIHRENDQ